jgi:cobalt/nickel transport system permease protein
VPIFAVHISDGVLSFWGWGIGAAIAVILYLPSLYRITEEEIPRIALLTAAFFVASSIHVKVAGTSVHLLLNGLVGVVLGRRAPLAIVVGLVLQAVLLGHGGYTTLGVNAAILTVPALIANILFRLIAGNRSPLFVRRAFWAGWVAGTISVLLTATATSLVLIIAGTEDWRVIATVVFVAHLPLALIEGGIVGSAAGIMARVKPELLLPAAAAEQEGKQDDRQREAEK